MPTLKKKPPAPPTASSPNDANGLASEVITLPEAAAYLRVSEPDLIDLVLSQNLPGRLIGGEWRFLKSAIQHWLSMGSSSSETRKAAQIALAGKYKDDPDLPRICEDAYRQRGRPFSEGE